MVELSAVPEENNVGLHELLQKVGKATIRVMANSVIHSTTNAELIEHNRRQERKSKRAKGNYGIARIMNEEVIKERRERQREQLWKEARMYYQKIHHDVFTYGPKLLKQRTDLSTKKGVNGRGKSTITTTTTTIKETPRLNTRLMVGLSLPPVPTPTPLSPTAIAEAALPAMLATPAPKARRPIRQQKRKQKLVVCLSIRVTIAELEQGLRARQIREKQANHVVGGISQSGRGMRMRKPTKP